MGLDPLPLQRTAGYMESVTIYAGTPFSFLLFSVVVFLLVSIVGNLKMKKIVDALFLRGFKRPKFNSKNAPYDFIYQERGLWCIVRL